MEDWNSKSEYLLGIVELNDDISPIEQNDKPQRWDTELVNGRNVDVINTRSSYEAVRQSQPLAFDGGFTKP